MYEYGRTNNPSRCVLENCLAALDGGKYCLAFASGMGAITTVLSMFNSGDHVISGEDIYGGTSRLLNNVISRFNIDISYIDTTDLKNVKNSIKSNTKVRKLFF